MRYYIVILSDLTTQGDINFSDYVKNNNFEFWRYTTLNWILATPDTVSTNTIMRSVLESYGPIFSFILEVTINDVAGIMPDATSNDPALWFHQVRSKDFTPKWEKLKSSKTEEK